MEKLIIALWKSSFQGDGDFHAGLQGGLAPELAAAGALQIRLNLQDQRVAAGAKLRQTNSQPAIDAVVQFWLTSANARFRAPIDAILVRYCQRFAAWIAVESTIIANVAHPPQPGQPTHGFSQATFLGQPPRLDYAAWRHIWQTSHTKVAIETQANFEYRQNILVQALTDEAPAMNGFVEECFPFEALTDPMVFFDAVGDTAKFDANLAAMMESCHRFIDFDQIDVLITSQYDF